MYFLGIFLASGLVITFWLIAFLVPGGISARVLMKVSGVTVLEKSIKDTEPGYVEYMTRTPAFFPRLLPHNKE